jgi:hypothetical protein
MSEGKRRIRWVAEVIALGGVIVSLVFVGMELRQNTRAVQGATYQALSDASADHFENVAHDPDLARLLDRVYRGNAAYSDFSSTENLQLIFLYFARLVRLENTYLQYKEGLVGESVFKSYGWTDFLFSTRHFQEVYYEWGVRFGLNSEFAAFLEDRIELAPPEEPAEGPAGLN